MRMQPLGIMVLLFLCGISHSRARILCWDSGWTEWQAIGSCSKSCGGGVQELQRTCKKTCTCSHIPVSPDCSAHCHHGDTRTTIKCNTGCCPVDGQWSAWTNVGTCSKSCGGGKQRQERYCNKPAPSCGGRPCTGDSVLFIDCNTQCCPVNGGWGAWTNVGTCSKSCGGGKQNQERYCNNPAPSCGGKSCPGDAVMLIDCNTQCCPVNGGWGAWTNVGTCSKSCGRGKQNQERYCNNPAPSCGGKSCPGDAVMLIDCNTQCCPVDGQWGLWENVGECDSTCGKGKQKQERHCTNPVPSCGGNPCPGESERYIECTGSGDCSVDGVWSEWETVSECNRSCGGGKLMQKRQCNNPSPASGGKYCEGPDVQFIGCNEEKCAADGGWSDWRSVEECSSTCRGGYRLQQRECNNPPPSGNGASCTGSSQQFAPCNNHILCHGGTTTSVTIQGEMEHGKALILSCIAPIPEDSTLVWCKYSAAKIYDCCACGTHPPNENNGCSFLTLWDSMEGYHVKLNLHECVISVFKANSSHNGIYSCESLSSDDSSWPVQFGKVAVSIPEWWKNPELVKATAGAAVAAAIIAVVLARCCCCCCRRTKHAGRGIPPLPRVLPTHLPVEDGELENIAGLINNLDDISNQLGLSQHEKNVIKKSVPRGQGGSHYHQLELLKAWKKKAGKNAAYQWLIEALTVADEFEAIRYIYDRIAKNNTLPEIPHLPALNTSPGNTDLESVGKLINKWDSVAHHLGLSKQERSTIEKAVPRSRDGPNFRQMEVLKVWKQKTKKKVTYLLLIEALTAADELAAVWYLYDNITRASSTTKEQKQD